MWKTWKNLLSLSGVITGDISCETINAKHLCHNLQKNSGLVRNPNRKRKVVRECIVRWRSLVGASFSFHSNFYEHKRELKPAERDGRSYFLRQAPRALVTRRSWSWTKTSLSSYRASENCSWRARRGYSRAHTSTRKLILREFYRGSPLSGRYVPSYFRWRKRGAELRKKSWLITM